MSLPGIDWVDETVGAAGTPWAVAWSPLLAALAAAGLGATPSSIATVALLSVLLAGLQHDGRKRTWLIAYCSLVIGNMLAYLPVVDGSGFTAGPALFALFGSALLNVLVPLLAIGLAFSMPEHLTLAKALALPILWPLVWTIYARVSPFGILGAWEWQAGGGLSWILTLFGPYIGRDLLLVTVALPVSTLLASSRSERQPLLSRRVAVGVLVVLFLSSLPAQFVTYREVSTAPLVKTACVLPPKMPTLELLAKDIRGAAARGAKIIQTPEAVISLSSLGAVDEFEQRMSEVALLSHAIVAAAYIGPARETQSGRRSNIVAIFDAQGNLAARYIKRHLMPFTESYYLEPGSGISPVLELDVPLSTGSHKHADVRKLRVAPAICHDSSFPHSLPSEAYDLLLVPASVYNPGIAVSRVRALQGLAVARRVAVLTCDAHSTSAFIDSHGTTRALQVGAASFEVPWRINQSGRSSRPSETSCTVAVVLALLLLCVEIAVKRKAWGTRSLAVERTDQEREDRSLVEA